MAPIRIHTSSPINANKDPASDDNNTGEAVGQGLKVQLDPTPTTTTSSQNPSYPPARPGASVPAPTGVPQRPAPQITPTRTTASASYFPTTSASPPPPQPGAVPTPSVPITSEARKPSIPPPPKAGEPVQPASYYAPQPTTAPTFAAQPPAPLPAHQQTGMIDSPYRAQPPASTTSAGPGPRPGDDASGLNGPPGYMQNSASAFQDRTLEPYNPFAAVGQSQANNTSGPVLGSAGAVGSSSSILGAGGGYPSGLDDAKESLSGMWDTAVSWARKAGEKLQEGEAEVWRRINEGNK